MVALQRSLDKSVQRTLVAVLLLLASMMLLAVLSLLGSTYYINSRLATVYADRVVVLHDLQRIGLLLNVELPERLARREPLAPQWIELDRTWAKYLATYLTPEEERLAADTGAQLRALRGAAQSPAAYRAALVPLNRQMAALSELQVRVAEEELLKARGAGRASWAWGLLLALLGGALVLLAIRLLAERIVRPVRATARSIEALAAGRQDEIPPLLSGDFAEVGEQLHRLRSFIAEREGLLAEEQRLSRSLRSAQAELVEAEKLASLGGLVAGVAHELNTPLGVAVSVASSLADKGRRFAAELAAGALRRSALEAFLAQTREASALLERNLLRAAELVRSFKQVAVDRTGMQRRPYELATVVDEVLASLRPAYGRPGIEWVNAVPVGQQLDGYPGALGQALTNLLANAALHGLRDRPGHITVGLQAADERGLELVVADDGAGMDEAVQARVFEPFFTTRLGSGGSGLGLPIVRNLVMGILGGRIRLESAPEQGSRFILSLPRRAPEAPAQAPQLIGEAGSHASA